MYSVIVTKKARKELNTIQEQHYDALRDAINGLAVQPRPIGCKKLIGTNNQYRIRVGVYRILYTIQDNVLTVTIIKVAHRKNVYR